MRLKNGKQVWFLIRDGKEFPQQVEVYPYNVGNGQITYYYKFDTQWFMYSNNQFNPSRIPPYYTSRTNPAVLTAPTVNSQKTTVSMRYSYGSTLKTKTMPSYTMYKPVSSVVQAPVISAAAKKAAAAKAKAEAAAKAKALAANAKAVQQNGAQTFKYKPVFNKNSLMSGNAKQVAKKALDLVTKIGQQAPASVGSAANPVQLPAVKTTDKPMVSINRNPSMATSLFKNMWKKQ
jgi:hypothetical protein